MEKESTKIMHLHGYQMVQLNNQWVTEDNKEKITHFENKMILKLQHTRKCGATGKD